MKPPGVPPTLHAYDRNRNRVSQEDAEHHVVSMEYDLLNRLTDTQQPNVPVQHQEYDANGNVTSLTDPKGHTFVSTYDFSDRLTNKTYPALASEISSLWRRTTEIAYQYDDNDNLVSVDESVVSGTDPPAVLHTARVYDRLDRLTSETAALPDGGSRPVTYTYFANGLRKSVTESSASTAYSYDAQNRPATVTTAGGATSYKYFPDDLLQEVAYPNGIKATYGYDDADRLTSISNARIASVVSSYAYGYDANGNRTSQVETNGGSTETTTYGFDDLNRLSRITYPVDTAFASGRVVTYGYDNVGNRTRETEKSTAGDVLADKQGVFDSLNRLTSLSDLVTPSQSTLFGYDDNGNQTSKTVAGVTTEYRYDCRDKMVEVVAAGGGVLGRFQYDFSGRRSLKIGADGPVQYVYDQTSVLSEYDETGLQKARYDYGSDRLISLVRSDEGRRWYSLDGLGSVVNLTDEAGSLVASYHLDAWGNFRFPSELSASKNHFAFTGYEWDPELGLFNAKARYFDPLIGRFTSQDSYLGQIDDPPSLHRYFYGNANPTRFIDPTGHEALDYVKDAGQSLYGFGKGVAKGAGNLVVGAVVGTGKLAITAAKLQYGTHEMKVQAAHELGEMGTAIIEGIKDQGRLLKQAASNPGEILDAAAEIGPERYGEVIGGATLDTALTATMFTGVGAGAKVAQGAEAVVVGESRVAVATAGAEQAATRARVLASLQESAAGRSAKAVEGFGNYAKADAAVGESVAAEGANAGVSRFRAIREALSDGNGKLLHPVEREGVKHAIREIEKQGYELAGSVKYRGNQGIDLAFKGTDETVGRYALAEAKAGSGLRTLATDTLGIRQGSYEFFRTRLARGIAYGDEASRPFYRELYNALRGGDVDLLGSFAGSNRPPVRFDPTLFERAVNFRKVPGAAVPMK